MDFSLSPEQQQLRTTISKYVAANYGVAEHCERVKAQVGYTPAHWQAFAELGLLGAVFSEEDGGYGGGAIDLMVIAEAFGASLVREPFLQTVVGCGKLLNIAGTAAQKAKYLPAIIDGSCQWALAITEPDSHYDLSWLDCSAVANGQGYVLQGEKHAVLNGQAADWLIVSARTRGEKGELEGISLFIVDANSTRRVPFTAVDGSGGAHIYFDGIALAAESLLGSIDLAYPLLLQAIDFSILAMGAEALGIMQVLLDATVEYTKTRQQFGQPIGKFQVLQHRMADMYLKLEESKALLLNAVITAEQEPARLPLASAALKVKVAEAGRFISQQAVQLHGGMGMTDELAVSHHFKRLLLLARLYGDEDYYLQRYASLARA